MRNYQIAKASATLHIKISISPFYSSIRSAGRIKKSKVRSNHRTMHKYRFRLRSRHVKGSISYSGTNSRSVHPGRHVYLLASTTVAPKSGRAPNAELKDLLFSVQFSSVREREREPPTRAITLGRGPREALIRSGSTTCLPLK